MSQCVRPQLGQQHCTQTDGHKINLKPQRVSVCDPFHHHAVHPRWDAHGWNEHMHRLLRAGRDQSQQPAPNQEQKGTSGSASNSLQDNWQIMLLAGGMRDDLMQLLVNRVENCR
jgi:hypothetical protein